MRFHVVGVGPIGSLVAHHLRRTLSPNHEICLLLRSAALARQDREKGRPIHIEYNGVTSTSSGFQVEAVDQPQEMLYNLVFGKDGKLRLPVPRHETPSGQETIAVERKRKRGEDIESLIVTCKAYSTLGILQRLQHRLKPESTIVLCQNGGLAIYEQIVRGIFRNPEERPNFILVSNNHGAWLKSPNHIVHAGIGTLQFGIVPDGRRDFEQALHDLAIPQHQRTLSLDDISHPRNDELHTRYRSLRNTVAVLNNLSELQPEWQSMSSLQLQMRRKLVVNSVINPLTALMGCRNGDLFANDAAQRLADRICSEAYNVFEAEAAAQASLEKDAPSPRAILPHALKKRQLSEEWQRVARLTAGNISSMLSDIRKGKGNTEIEYLNGYVVQLASRYGVRAPINASMVDLIKLRTSIPMDTPL